MKSFSPLGLSRIRALLGLLAFLASIAGSHAQPSPSDGFSPVQKDSVRAALSLFPQGTQFALGIVDGNSESFYGLRKGKEGMRELSNADSVFRIGSLTKVFTASLLAEFVHQGRVGPKEVIWGPLGIDPRSDTPITFEHLASHTSGLPKLPSGLLSSSDFSLKNPYKDYGRNKLESYLRERMKLKSAPGASYRYSNLGYGILGYALTKIADSSYEALIQTHVAGPLGMERTTVKLEKIEEWALEGLNAKGKTTPYWDLAAMKGAGALFSTARDLSRFVRANFDTADPVMALQQKVVHRANRGLDIAWGWHVLKQRKGGRWYWHNGGTGGFRSSLVMDLDARKAVIVLANVSAGHPNSSEVDRLSYELLRMLL